MKTIIRLIIKDLIRFINDKPAVLLTFVVPLVLIIIFGNIFSGSGGPRGRAKLILVNESNSIVAKLIEQKLDSSKSLRPIKTYVAEESNDTLNFDEKTAKEWVQSGKISAAVIMPKDFLADTSTSLKFKFYYDPKNEIESSIIQGNIQQTIFTQIPRILPILMQRTAINEIGKGEGEKFIKNMSKIIGETFKINPDSLIRSITILDSTSLFQQTTDSSSENSFVNNLVKFESEQLVGKKITNPGLTRTVGGWAMMFLLFTLSGAATSMFEEKQEGTLKRILCMPITRAQILWSKYIYSILLGVVQLIVLFFFSWVLFDVEIFSNLGNLFLVMVVSAAAAVSFGMAIISVAKSINQASGFSTLLILVMSALGGSWFPVSLLPDWMQLISKATITYWSVEAFLQVLWRQADLITILPNLTVLIFFTFLVNTYSLVRFQKGWI